MKLLLVFMLAFLQTTTALATAQYPDKLFYNGKEYALYSNPLESYFDKHPDKRPRTVLESSALWRGYIASFEILDSQLYVKDIEIQVYDTTGEVKYKTKWKSVLKEVFPGQEKLKVDWLTGLLVIPYGKLVDYVHMGYGSTYEKYILLEIDKGDLKKEKKYNYKEYEKFKDRQFEAFKQTEEYLKLKANLKKDGSTDAFIDSFLRSFVTDYTTKILGD
jgi:hypothetical protein